MKVLRVDEVVDDDLAVFGRMCRDVDDVPDHLVPTIVRPITAPPWLPSGLQVPHAHGSAGTGPYDVVWRLFRMDGLEFGPSLRRGETRTTLIFGGSPYGVDVLAVLHV